MQPIIIDDQGVPRFKANSVVRWMKEKLHELGSQYSPYECGVDFPRDDWEQFLQLAGYSVGGYCELTDELDEGYVSNASADAAVEATKATGFPWQQGKEAIDKWNEERRNAERAA